MNKKTIYLILGVIVIILIIITIKGFSLLGPQVPSQSTATTTAGIPDGLAISDELGGNDLKNSSQTNSVPAGTIRGSCYIKADSQCIEYFGSAFSPSRIKAVCSNDGAVISTNGSNCPAEARVGGCRTMIGTEMEMIAWAYSNGDKPVEGDVLEFNKTLCNGMANSGWIGAGTKK